MQTLGIQVDPVSSGAGAVTRAEQEFAAGRPHDIMLIDWKMEPVDGIETLRRLRQSLGDRMPPSILVTAFDATVVRPMARVAKFDAVLVKPVTVSALQDCLVGVLDKPEPTAWLTTLAPGDSETQLRERYAGHRVLLVEDNLINQELAKALLTAVGLVVETAEDGVQAVELALARPYDLILMDMQMPRMDGLAATRAIRESAATSVPIIAMTANAFNEERSACLKAGMNAHLAKPVDPELLYATLLQWLAQRVDPTPGDRDVRPLPPGDAPASRSLQDRLAAIQDYDVVSGLGHVGGEMTVLERVLRQFVQTYAGGEPTLLVCGAPDTVTRWRRVCHSLRSACGAVGATRLAAQFQAFEDELDGVSEMSTLALRAVRLHDDLVILVRRLKAGLDA